MKKTPEGGLSTAKQHSIVIFAPTKFDEGSDGVTGEWAVLRWGQELAVGIGNIADFDRSYLDEHEDVAA
jgi:hypothetical protein